MSDMYDVLSRLRAGRGDDWFPVRKKTPEELAESVRNVNLRLELRELMELERRRTRANERARARYAKKKAAKTATK